MLCEKSLKKETPKGKKRVEIPPKGSLLDRLQKTKEVLMKVTQVSEDDLKKDKEEKEEYGGDEFEETSPQKVSKTKTNY